MNEADEVEFNIEVNIADAREIEIDRTTRQLLSKLRELNVESAKLAGGGTAPGGTKSGDQVMIGSIVISALPAVLPAVVALVQAWVARGQGRTAKFKGRVGKELIEFEGSPEDLHKLLETLSTRKKN